MIRSPLFSPDELHIVPTADGWSIALGRYRPRAKPVSREPVILCHGLGANRFNLDLDERYSVARSLARRGFDAWVLELRGRGLVSRPSRDDAPLLFNFDDQAQHDVPTAIDFVLKVTGAERVSWVGHSKGGLLLYAYLARDLDAQERVASAILLGSGGGFGESRSLRRRLRLLIPLLSRLPVMPTGAIRGLARMVPPPRWLWKNLANLDNIDPAIGQIAAATIVEDLPVGVVRQFLTWIGTGRFLSLDEKTDYLDGLRKARVPMLFVAGAKDPFCPPETIAVAHEALIAPEKKMIVAGVANGFSADYGHGDLAIGRNAPEEIFPLIDAFLGAHATAPAVRVFLNAQGTS